MDWAKGDAGIRDHMGKGVLKMFILFSLAKKEMHGYALLKTFNGKAKTCLKGWKVGIGEFYALLTTLEEAGIVRSSWTDEGRPKKVFSLTPKGRAIVKKAKGRFASAMKFFREIVPEVFGKAGRSEVSGASARIQLRLRRARAGEAPSR